MDDHESDNVSIENVTSTMNYELQERASLIDQFENDQETLPPQPVEQESSSPQSPVEERDYSHIEGMCNAIDTDQVEYLTVSGELPSWLVGEHYTIGPGTYDIKYTRKIEVDGHIQSATATFTFGHLLDALPLVNRFDLDGSQNSISCRGRLTSRRLIEKIRDHHGYAPVHPSGLFKTDQNQTVLVKFLKSASKASKPDGEPCGARILPSIPGIGGRLFAQNLANHIQELDPADLKPTRTICWDEINPEFKGYSSCPNGQFDAATGDYINFTMEIGYRETRYRFFSLSDRDTKGSVIATIRNAPTAYVNSFALTQHYIVLVLFPFYTNSSAVKYSWNESIMDSFSFQASEPTLFYVISREKGEVVANYRADPCFAFNHVNAHEDERGNIFVDMICYRDETIANQLATDALRHPESMVPPRLANSELRRYQLHDIHDAANAYDANQGYMPTVTSVTARMSTLFSYVRGSKAPEQTSVEDTNPWYAWMPTASYQKLVEASVELPQINPNYKMKPYTFMYSLGFSAASAIKDGSVWDSIVKTNVTTKSVDASWHEPGCYPSEAVFVPRPAAADDEVVGEDEGVLLCVVLDAKAVSSFLLILDAATLKEVARANVGRVIPLSFGHGGYRLRRHDG